jgi:biopolymer transport protein ExbD
MNEEELDSPYQPLAEMNIIPLVDVMLVLLIIFMITAPLFTPHLLQVTLPQVTTSTVTAPPTTINLTLDVQNRLFFNEVELSEMTFNTHLQQWSQQQPKPIIHLYVDKQVTYQKIANVLASLQKTGISQIGLAVLEAK